MSKVRRRYTLEFKLEVVRLVTTCGYSVAEVSRRLELNDDLVRRWRRLLAPPCPNAVVPPERVAEPASDESKRSEQERRFLRKATDLLMGELIKVNGNRH